MIDGINQLPAILVLPKGHYCWGASACFFHRQEPHQMRASSSSEADFSLGVRAIFRRIAGWGNEEGMVECTTCYSLILVTRIYIYIHIILYILYILYYIILYLYYIILYYIILYYIILYYIILYILCIYYIYIIYIYYTVYIYICHVPLNVS